MNRDRRKRIADLVEKLSGIMIELDEAIETANDEKLSGIKIELDEAIETANDEKLSGIMIELDEAMILIEGDEGFEI